MGSILEKHDTVVLCFGVYFIQLDVQKMNLSVHQMVLVSPICTCVTISLTALMDLMSRTVLQVSLLFPYLCMHKTLSFVFSCRTMTVIDYIHVYVLI